jgi:malonate-semialdehyde dehydrogenase (acetylating)/methylmalonate-semialdehyde dehydrogenase
MGPLITKQHREKVLGYIEQGIKEGAKLLLDGRAYKDPKNPEGYYLGPSIFDDVTPDMVIGKEEIFGPVLCCDEGEGLRRAVEIVKKHELGNATSIFTTSGKWAREYRYRVEPSMLGVEHRRRGADGVLPVRRRQGSFFGDSRRTAATASSSTRTRRWSSAGGSESRRNCFDQTLGVNACLASSSAD